MTNGRPPLTKEMLLTQSHLIGEQVKDFFGPEILECRTPEIWEEFLMDYLLENSLNLLLEAEQEEWAPEIVDHVYGGMRTVLVEMAGMGAGPLTETLFKVRKQVFKMLI